MKHIILDYGHGSNTPGKCAPDKSFHEWRFTRQVGREVARRLRNLGYEVHETWTEDHEPGYPKGETMTAYKLSKALMYRVNEVNRLCKEYSAANCLCVSIHVNAAGDGRTWNKARGFLACVGLKASSNSKRLAKCIYEQAEKRGLKGNRWVPAGKCIAQSLAMCDKTNCPAVLTENLYMDNADDLAMLKSEQCFEAIVETHVHGIIGYTS